MRFTNEEELAIWRRSGLEHVLAPAVFADLRNAYSAPDRRYHDWTHALSVLSWVNHVCDVVPEGVLAPFTFRDMRLAAVFHDVVYASEGSPANEQASAALLNMHVDGDTSRAAEIVLATARHGKLEAEGTPFAIRLFMDCDIATFGEYRWEIALWNDRNVVAELLLRYPAEQVAEGRKNFLRGMLAKQSIFLSEQFRVPFEAQARINIARLLRLAEGTEP